MWSNQVIYLLFSENKVHMWFSSPFIATKKIYNMDDDDVGHIVSR